MNNVATGATFVDATFCHERAMREMVKFINKYGEGKIRIVVVDFFNTTPLVVVKARNEGRKGTIRYVPKFVIDCMYDSACEIDMNNLEVYSPEEIQFSFLGKNRRKCFIFTEFESTFLNTHGNSFIKPVTTPLSLLSVKIMI